MVYARGKSAATSIMALKVLRRRFGDIRVGFTVGKKTGKAVTRNKIRRRMKEAFRVISPELEGSAHIVFIARAAISEAHYSDILRDMDYLLKRVGLAQKPFKKR